MDLLSQKRPSIYVSQRQLSPPGRFHSLRVTTPEEILEHITKGLTSTDSVIVSTHLFLLLYDSLGLST